MTSVRAAQKKGREEVRTIPSRLLTCMRKLNNLLKKIFSLLKISLFEKRSKTHDIKIDQLYFQRRLRGQFFS